VLFCLGIAILLSHTEVDDVDNVGDFSTRSADEEVVWLDVAVDEILFVNSLDARDHLFGDHNSSLGGEATIAEVEKVLK